ncbi:MAG: hypothetical protein Q4B26_14805 [Eubacteriales bacterium]|nr:hypothetical protein [Eubacteriales bacterium]
MAERVYFPINEEAARTAHNMMSFSEYKAGSLTASYNAYVDEAYDLADKAVEKRPDEAERVYKIAGRYAKRLADNLNARSRIGMMCPSVMISGAGNFPVRKKEKQNAANDKNMREFQEIQKIPDQIKSIANGSEIIKSGDSDAIERLERKIEEKKARQEMMKEVNTFFRKHETLIGCEAVTLKEAEALMERMNNSYHYEKKPFMTFELTNNNQEIRRLEGRLKKLKEAKEQGDTRTENKYFKVVENTEIMRLQLIFDGKPESEVRDILKKNGFRWSPRNDAWQRQLTDNARYSMKMVLKALEAMA